MGQREIFLSALNVVSYRGKFETLPGRSVAQNNLFILPDVDSYSENATYGNIGNISGIQRQKIETVQDTPQPCRKIEPADND